MSLPKYSVSIGQLANRVDDSDFEIVKVAIPSSNLSAFKFVQPLKAELPIEETLLPIMTFVSPVQPLKASVLIDITLFGMDTLVIPVHPLKAEIPIEETLLPIMMFCSVAILLNGE